ncbi:hypothetical protein ACOTJS_31050 [Achromobacter xylosoxidans]|uniref:hypothetical protein n=1 Tax=Alcaligenes xylosoxydans xylosoxydans TaxID=85698 RepID=UPI001F11446E|nr:hypothetical protein [Achromobacter xylosoxidans]MCH4576188.1 hypothetical protein [Achromobacter xylosoxidans]
MTMPTLEEIRRLYPWWPTPRPAKSWGVRIGFALIAGKWSPLALCATWHNRVWERAMYEWNNWDTLEVRPLAWRDLSPLYRRLRTKTAAEFAAETAEDEGQGS